jgi:hypothetical protein
LSFLFYNLSTAHLLFLFYNWSTAHLPMCCLFFFDLRILITPLVSSSWSCLNGNTEINLKKPFVLHFLYFI